MGKTADLVAKLLSKGQEVVIEGKIVNNNYETKEGEKRFGTTIELNDFLLVSSREEEKK